MKTVIVTGATKGIGFAACSLFASKGWQVYGLYSGASTSEEDLQTLKDLGCLTIKADLKDPEAVRLAFQEILSKTPRIDCLVNNAGISYIGLLQDMSVEEWDTLMNVNLRGTFLCTKAVLPSMIRQQNGCIINVSSMWGDRGASMEVAYSASKGGINAFTKALAQEVAPSGIRVNAVSFGAIETSMNHFLSEEEKIELESSIGLGRFGTVEEAAKTILFLAEDATYMSGSILTMDGGF